MPHRLAPTAAALAGALLLAGCMHGGRMGGPGHDDMHQRLHGSGPMARADLQPTAGNATAGRVMVHGDGEAVYLHARVSGLKPNQAHGFHVHEKGDCSAPDATSAGGHFNPTNKPHGAPGGERHAGDLPALQADAAGNADLRVRVTGLSVGSGEADIVGKALIVHAQPDDYATQPTGNSGARLACAVIARVR